MLTGPSHAAEHRLLGLQPDPLAQAFAWVLALPWSLLLQWPGGFTGNAARAVLVAGMLSNLGLGVLWLVRWRD